MNNCTILKLNCFLLLASCLFMFSLQTSAQDPVLFTIEGEPVYVSEFEYVYNKNNINNQSDYSRESLEEYLDLYIKFRLKVLEAEAQGYDTIKALQDELAGYRKQLAKSYLNDTEIMEKLLQEAHERMKWEINASHILVAIKDGDDEAAKGKILDIASSINAGDKTFEQAAMALSDDPSAKKNQGNIGWFTVFQTVYPFETAAYQTEKGEISAPVKTKFGYHLLKINDKRPAKGTVTAAHILFKISNDASVDQIDEIETKANTIYKQIKSEENTFEAMVIAHSDDKFTKTKSGILPAFGTGKMVEEFENAAFALQEGEISKPLRTDYGWHIIKLIKKEPIPEFIDAKRDLKRKVERDDRSKLARKSLVENIKQKHDYLFQEAAYVEMLDSIDERILKASWKMDNPDHFRDPLFIIGGKAYTQAEFGKFIMQNRKRPKDRDIAKLVKLFYQDFEEQKIMQFQEDRLEQDYPAFKKLVKEYRDGILLFELTDNEVWSKASADSASLVTFHAANRDNYMWKERAVMEIYNCKTKESCETAKKMIQKKKTANEISGALNTAENAFEISHTAGKFEQDDNDLYKSLNWKPGVSEVIEKGDGSFSVVKITEMVPAEPKKLEEAKGYVISDYQNQLEKKWLHYLENKYMVQTNEAALEALIKK